MKGHNVPERERDSVLLPSRVNRVEKKAHFSSDLRVPPSVSFELFGDSTTVAWLPLSTLERTTVFMGTGVESSPRANLEVSLLNAERGGFI